MNKKLFIFFLIFTSNLFAANSSCDDKRPKEETIQFLIESRENGWCISFYKSKESTALPYDMLVQENNKQTPILDRLGQLPDKNDFTNTKLTARGDLASEAPQKKFKLLTLAISACCRYSEDKHIAKQQLKIIQLLLKKGAKTPTWMLKEIKAEKNQAHNKNRTYPANTNKLFKLLGIES